MMPSARMVAVALACVMGLAMPTATAEEEDEEALVVFNALAPRLAMELALATLDACAERGFQVAVAVVDRFGVPQAMIRDRFAGAHTPEAAVRKAWTAASFRVNTLELDRSLGVPGDVTFGARSIPGTLILGGGIVVEVAGELVGAIGVSGASSPEFDEDCARDGLAAIEGKLPL